MKLKEKDKIEIGKMEFIVDIVRDINFTHTENKKTYYTYLLGSKDENITHASLDYISDENIIFHLTKKIKANIKEKEISIDSKTYEILSHEIGIFMDYGEHKDVHEYKLKGDFEGTMPSELHILPNGIQIFYLNKKIELTDIKIK